MHTYQFNMGTGPVKMDKGTLTWNQNGSLSQLQINDQIVPANSQTCTYSHDDLARIASVSCGTNIWSQTFTYDPFGNITKTVPGGSTGTSFQPTYDSSKNRISSTPFTYDGNNGNLTADDIHSYGWNANGKMATIDNGAISLEYDALGRMVEQNRISVYTQIIYSPTGDKLALMSGQTLSKAFVPLLAGSQAVYNASGLQYYRHADWLGSSRLATTPSRTKYYDVAYAPFGEPYAGSGTQDLMFTGQNQDTVSSAVPGGQGGLYDFLFRGQTPVQGRWLSPDPAGLAAANRSDPQTWNRYAYVRNSPLTAVDPSGLDLCWNWDYFISHAECDDGYFFFTYYNPFDFGPILGGGGGGGGFGGGHGGGGRRIGGRYPNGETLGLPAGLNRSPLSSIDGLLGLLPGINCGDSTSSFTAAIGGVPGFCDTTLVDLLPIVGATVFASAFGRDRISGKCDRTETDPKYGHCSYVCTFENSEGEPSSIAGAYLGVGELAARCGPIVHCPSIVGIDKKVFCVFGVCVGYGKTEIRYCIP